MLKEQIIKVLNENGYNMANAEDIDNFNIFADFDSLQYISFISEIEQTFGVIIPDDYLENESITSFSQFVALVAELIETSKCNQLG